jgi:hypothetical protein
MLRAGIRRAISGAAILAACQSPATRSPVSGRPADDQSCAPSVIELALRWTQEGRLERVRRIANVRPSGCKAIPTKLAEIGSDADAEIRRIARSGDPDAIYARAEAVRKRDPAEANRLLAGALRALEVRGRAPVSLGNNGVDESRWYHGPIPPRAANSKRGWVAIDGKDAFIVADAATGREAFRIEPARAWELSPNHAWLLADAGETLVLTEVSTLKERAVLHGDLDKAVFDSMSRRLAWVNDRNEVALMDLETSKEEVLLRAPPPRDPDDSSDVWKTISFSGNSKWLAATAQFQISVVDLATASELRAPKEEYGDAQAEFSPDSRWFGWIGPKGVEAMELANGRRLQVRAPVQTTSLGFHPTRAELAAGGELGSLFVLDLKRGSTRTLLRADSTPEESPTGTRTENARYVPDGSHLVFQVGAATQIVDAKNGAAVRWPDECQAMNAAHRGLAITWPWPVPDAGCENYWPSAWSRSGRLFFGEAVPPRGAGLVADWSARRALWRTSWYAARPQFSDDEHWLLAGGAVFDAATGERLPAPRLHPVGGGVSSVQWGTDGILHFAADFGRGTEVCTLERTGRVGCRFARGWSDVLLGKRAYFTGVRTLTGTQPQVVELRDADGELVAKGTGEYQFFAPPTSDVIAVLSHELRFLDPSGAPLGSPLPLPAGASASFDRFGKSLVVWGGPASKLEILLVDVKTRRELVRTTAVSAPTTRFEVEPPAVVGDRGGKLFVAEANRIRGIDVKTGKIAISIEVDRFDGFAPSDTRPLLLVATPIPKTETAPERSKIHVFDVSGSKPKPLYDVTLSKLGWMDWIPESDSWIALSQEGFVVVSPKPEARRVVEVFPTGVAARTNDTGIVELGPGGSSWLACISGDYALPADACEDRFAPLDSADTNGFRALW